MFCTQLRYHRKRYSCRQCRWLHDLPIQEKAEVLSEVNCAL